MLHVTTAVNKQAVAYYHPLNSVGHIKVNIAREQQRNKKTMEIIKRQKEQTERIKEKLAFSGQKLYLYTHFSSGYNVSTEELGFVTRMLPV